MRARPPLRRPAAVLAAVLATGLAAVGLAPAVPPAGASAPPGPSLTLSAATGSPVHGDIESVTATATAADGSPVPDGTPVSFRIAQSSPWTLTVGSPAVDLAVVPGGAGGWLLRADGSVTALGDAPALGDAQGRLPAAAVALAATPSGAGYWLAAADGTVLPFGDAARYDVADGGVMPPAAPVVDLVPTLSGHGYWLLTAGGTTIPFGDALLFRRLSGPKGNGTGVAMAATPSGAGYWVLRADGVVVAYGDAVAAGDPSAQDSAQSRMVGLAPTATGRGYWVTSNDGRVYGFGDAVALGTSTAMPAFVVGITPGGSGPGYWLTGRDGQVYRYGGTPDLGWPGNVVPTVGGRATVQFSSSAPVTSTVVATIPDTAGGGVSPPLTIRWRSGPPATISLSPADPASYVAIPVSFTATVTDAGGFPVDDGTPVAFHAAGTGGESPPSGSVVTAGGMAAVRLTSTSPGRSTVTVGAGAASATTSVTWWPADLSLWLGTGGPVSLGSPAVFTAQVTAVGGQPTPATLTFTLPPDTPATLDRGAWACDGGVGTFTCRAVVTPNQPATLQFHIRPATAGVATVTGTVSADAGPDGNPSDDTETATATVGPEPEPPVLSQTAGTEVIGATHVVTVQSDATAGTPVTFGIDAPAEPLPGGPWTAFAGTPTGDGYWLASAAGAVVARGTAPDLGGATGPLGAPVVDLRPTPTGNGYWLVTAGGTVIARGDATDAGSLSGPPAHPIVGMAVTGSGDGYWLADSAGTIYPFGDAFRPAATATVPPGGVVDIEGCPAGDGFWLLGADGSVQGFGVPAYGDPRPVPSSFGSPGVVAMTATPTGAGYWIAYSSGAFGAFGDARWLPSSVNVTPLGGAPTVALDTASASGVWTMAADGSLQVAGSAPFYGPTAVVPLTGSGTAQLSYTAAHAGPIAVRASVPGTAGPIDAEALSTAWTPAAAGSIRLSPDGSTLPAGTERRMAALVLDSAGLPVADGTPVRFSASGTGNEDPAGATATTAGGRATFAFTSGAPGTTTVKATAGTLWATTTVRWTAPARPLPPSAPQHLDASVGNGGVVVMWGPPASAGTSPITRYTITASPGGHTVTAAPGSSLIWVDGLTDGVAYTFTVTAWNDAGAGPGAHVGPMTPSRPDDAGSPGDVGGGSSDVGSGSGGSGSGSAGDSGGAGPAGGGSGATGAGRSAGYWMLGRGGAVYPFGTAADLGGLTLPAAVNAVDLEPTPSAAGYWILDSRGVVHPFGDARPFGDVDLGRLDHGETPASLSATPTGAGYWVFTSRGRVLPFGDARFFGDLSKVTLNGPVLDSIPTPTGLGYYMVASDGGIFAFGDAHFAGSMGQTKLNAPVRSLVPDSDGSGYWLVASDGGIFAFDAGFLGSMGGTPLNQPITGMVRYGNGYLMAASDGGVFDFSDLPFAGSLGGRPPARPVVAVAAA